MTSTSITGVAEALFVSNLQPSDQPTIEQVAVAALGSLLQHGGVSGCAGICAAEFGDHPETAPARMRWALAMARRFGRRRGWLPRVVPSAILLNRTSPLAQLARLVAAAGAVRSGRSVRRARSSVRSSFRRYANFGILFGALIGAATFVGNLTGHDGLLVQSGIAVVCVAAGVGGAVRRGRFGARRAPAWVVSGEPRRVSPLSGATDVSQDWIIQHLFALGLKLQAAAARSDIDRVREEMEVVVDGLDEVIVRVRRAKVVPTVGGGVVTPGVAR